MNIILQAFGTVIGNIIVFFSIPFIWWFVKWRKDDKFFHWIGLYLPKLSAPIWMLIVFALLYAINYFYNVETILPEADAVLFAENGSIQPANGALEIIASFITCFFANGLCEEVFFRGFLTKRLINKLGLYPGIIIQALLFAAMHNVLWIVSGVGISVLAHSIIFIWTFIGAILLGLLNEKIFNGSIIPSIILHGLGNFLTAL